MICPHCRCDLRRRERGRYRCRRCRRRFAFDPKTNPFGLHDLRLLALAAVLSTRGRDGLPPLGYTEDQLRYAVARRYLVAAKPRTSTWATVAVLVGIVGGIVAFGLWAISRGGAELSGRPAATSPVAASLGIVLALILLLVLGHLLTSGRRRFPGMPVDPAGFARMTDRWARVHGAPPPGMLAWSPPRVVRPGAPPRVALYCTDPAIVPFLEAADLARRQPVVLVPAGPGSIPELRGAVAAGLPVLVLHDADPAGCLAASALRAALPDSATVADVGLRPGPGATLAPAVLRRPPRRVRATLHAADPDLAPDELDRLATGRTVALAAVLPARLLRAVERAVERAATGADPDPARAAARSVGFLNAPTGRPR